MTVTQSMAREHLAQPRARDGLVVDDERRDFHVTPRACEGSASVAVQPCGPVVSARLDASP